MLDIDVNVFLVTVQKLDRLYRNGFCWRRHVLAVTVEERRF